MFQVDASIKLDALIFRYNYNLVKNGLNLFELTLNRTKGEVQSLFVLVCAHSAADECTQTKLACCPLKRQLRKRTLGVNPVSSKQQTVHTRIGQEG